MDKILFSLFLHLLFTETVLRNHILYENTMLTPPAALLNALNVVAPSGVMASFRSEKQNMILEDVS